MDSAHTSEALPFDTMRPKNPRWRYRTGMVKDVRNKPTTVMNQTSQKEQNAKRRQYMKKLVRDQLDEGEAF